MQCAYQSVRTDASIRDGTGELVAIKIQQTKVLQTKD